MDDTATNNVETANAVATKRWEQLSAEQKAMKFDVQGNPIVPVNPAHDDIVDWIDTKETVKNEG